MAKPKAKLCPGRGGSSGPEPRASNQNTARHNPPDVTEQTPCETAARFQTVFFSFVPPSPAIRRAISRRCTNDG